MVDLPTTTGPIILFNSSPAGQGAKVLVIKRVSACYASGTEGAAGFGLFGGVTPSVLATPLTANSTGCSVQATRGYGTSVAFVGVAKAIATGTAWQHLGGIVTLAATLTGNGYSAETASHPFVVPPLFAFSFGVLSDLGTTAKYLLTVAWDECEATLP